MVSHTKKCNVLVLNFPCLGFDNLSRAKRARLDSTEAMVTDAQSGYRYLQRGLGSTSRNMETTASQILAEVSIAVAFFQFHLSV